MAFQNDPTFVDDFRKVGADVTVGFEPATSLTSATDHASSENLQVAPKDDDLEEDEAAIDEDDDLEDDDEDDEELEDDDDEDEDLADDEDEDDLEDDDDEEDDEEEADDELEDDDEDDEDDELEDDDDTVKARNTSTAAAARKRYSIVPRKGQPIRVGLLCLLGRGCSAGRHP